jgi:hypothetical protein
MKSKRVPFGDFLSFNRDGEVRFFRLNKKGKCKARKVAWSDNFRVESEAEVLVPPMAVMKQSAPITEMMPEDEHEDVLFSRGFGEEIGFDSPWTSGALITSWDDDWCCDWF